MNKRAFRDIEKALRFSACGRRPFNQEGDLLLKHDLIRIEISRPFTPEQVGKCRLTPRGEKLLEAFAFRQERRIFQGGGRLC